MSEDKKFKDSYVLCIGGMNVDKKVQLLENLVLETSNPVVSSLSAGGVARNIAENLGRLGLPVKMLSVAGDDESFTWLEKEAEDFIDFSFVDRLSGKITSNYTAILDLQGDMCLALADMTICEEMTPKWLTSHKDAVKQAALVIADLNLPQETLAALIQLTNEGKIPLAIIPVSGPKMKRIPDKLHGVTWIVVNEDESKTRYGEHELPELATLWQRDGVENIVITKGTKCGVFADVTGIVKTFTPIKAEQVCDVTGAGDSFSSGVLYGTLKGASLEESIGYGLTNSYYTVQAIETVRKDLNAKSFEKEYQQLKERGLS